MAASDKQTPNTILDEPQSILINLWPSVTTAKFFPCLIKKS